MDNRTPLAYGETECVMVRRSPRSAQPVEYAMGYDVFITRADDPCESDQHPIPEADRQALLRFDKSLEPSTSDMIEELGVDGRTVRIPMILWTAHPDRPAFMLINGAVQTKSPDTTTIQKMVEMADRLGGRVIGEEGETYPQGSAAQSSQMSPSFALYSSMCVPLLIAFLVGCALLAISLALL